MQLCPTPDDLAAAAELLRRGGDPRRSFCRAAARLLHADTALLWEVRDDALQLTASAGSDAAIGDRLALGPGSAAGRAAAGGARVFASDTPAEAATPAGVRAILAEPIHVDGFAPSVVVVGWRRPVADLDPVVAGFVSLVAVQASIAIERADLAERLEHQALTDPLTDLLNRRGLARELDRETARALRLGSPLAFAMMDIDRFKGYNDRHGHPAGDRLLVLAADAWCSRVRAHDTVARYGGEEFVLLLPDCGGVGSALEIAERVRAATPGGLTVSVGLAIWDGHEPQQALAARADAALYVAKSRGRDRALAV